MILLHCVINYFLLLGFLLHSARIPTSLYEIIIIKYTSTYFCLFILVKPASTTFHVTVPEKKNLTNLYNNYTTQVFNSCIMGMSDLPDSTSLRAVRPEGTGVHIRARGTGVHIKENHECT